MSTRLFGTDGMRGRVNTYPMTPEVALRLGLAAGTFYRSKNRRSRVVIGKDTRLSGYVFENALAAGLLAAGMDVFLVGPLPTPAISFLTTNMRADLGVVISASHNPYSDNGIKFFSAEGFKIPDADEDRMTEMVLDPDFDWNYPDPADTGRAYKIKDAPGRYIVYLKNSFPSHLSLEGLRVVIDCANGANYRVAPLALEELGAEVVRIGTEPNGLNINYRCGSLYPEAVAAKVRETRADIGLALDGDADRLIVVDEKGAVLDGDQIMALCAQDLMQQGKLPGNILVATVMSAGSFHEGAGRHAGTHQCGRPPCRRRHAAARRAARRGAVGASHFPRVQHDRRWPAGRPADSADHAPAREAAFRTGRPAYAVSAGTPERARRAQDAF